MYNFHVLKQSLALSLLFLFQFLPAQTLLPFRQNGLWGYAEKGGKIVIPARFLEARVFQDGVGVVKAATQEKPNGAYGFISPTGRWIVEPTFEAAMEFYEGFILLKSGGKWGLADKKGNWFLSPRFDDAWDYNEGLARVQTGGKWGFIDKNGKWVTPPVFDDAWYFNEVLADSPFTASKVGIYSGTNWQIRTGLKNFRHTGYFSEGLALVRIPGEGWGLVDKAERFIAEKSFSNK